MNNLQRDILNAFSFKKRSAENPSSSLSNPANWLVDLFGSTTSSGLTVTPESSLGLPAVWSAVWMLSSVIGSLPLPVYIQTDEGRESDKLHDLFPLLNKKANEYMTSFTWRQTSMLHVLLWGNSYSLIVREKMKPVELLPFHPSKVQIGLKDGKIFYKFENGDWLGYYDILHIKGISFDGIIGKSPITILREMLGGALAQQKFSTGFYNKGAKLDGVIEVPGSMNPVGAKNLRRTWKDTYEGSSGERVAILDAGMKYQSIGVPPEDSQFIETAKFSITDVARIFRIPPPLLYDLEKATFSNIIELILSFTKFDLLPWLENWEQEINDKLFLESEKNNTFVEFNIEGLLRGDIKTRAEVYRNMIQNGIITPKEARAKENWNAGVDKFYMPMNYAEISNEETKSPKPEKPVTEKK